MQAQVQCPHCGTMNPSGKVFCTSCGNALMKVAQRGAGERCQYSGCADCRIPSPPPAPPSQAPTQQAIYNQGQPTWNQPTQAYPAAPPPYQPPQGQQPTQYTQPVPVSADRTLRCTAAIPAKPGNRAEATATVILRPLCACATTAAIRAVRP